MGVCSRTETGTDIARFRRLGKSLWIGLCPDDPYLFSGKVQYFTWNLIGVQDALVLYTLPNPKVLRKEKEGYLLDNSQDPLVMGWEKEGWKGKAWWPTNYNLVKRPVWIIEATPKDEKYAYGVRCSGLIESYTLPITKKCTTERGNSGECC